MTERTYDIVVWGASGFTGRLVAEYLAAHYRVDGSLKWAIAGRNLKKLAAVAAEVGAEGAPVIEADADDPSSLDALARQTKVVVTTVGPYQKYGSALVAACAAAGTDYVDLSGEPPWMRRMIDAHDEAAAASGARIVHSCGFDSIPFDLGVYFVQMLAQQAFGAPAREVKGRVMKMKGAMSGGTAASALETVEAAAKDKFVREVMTDPYSLAPDAAASRPRQPKGRRPHYDVDAKTWVAPFIMADINVRNVHRSNMLMDYPYGQDFVYTEMMAAPNAGAAYMIAGGLGGFAGAIAFPPTRALMRQFVLPKPGDGPSKRQREEGFYKVLYIAKGEGGEVRAVVEGDRDPGYGSTSKMIAEAAVCLARDVDRDACPGGVYTPAAAMGAHLIARLEENAGLTFSPA